jgi:arylsulfatase A-like enzyme
LGDRWPFRPHRHGFDHFYGVLYSHDMTLPVVHWPPIRLFRNDVIIESPVKQRLLTQRFTKEALRFIEENQSRPFLLYLAYTMPHLPWSASPGFVGKSKRGLYGDAVQEIDWSVGEILDDLSRRGLTEDTAVFFLSDNGPQIATPGRGGITGGLRGGKGTAWEGGIRVPCIVRAPGRVLAKSVLGGMASIMDLFPTVIRWAGAKLPDDRAVDGVDLTEFLQGKAPEARHDLGIYHLGRLFAVRSGEWKLHFMKIEPDKKGVLTEPIPCRPPELYSLAKDPAERNNVYRDYPQVAARLAATAEDLRSSVTPGRLPPSRLRSLFPKKVK